MDKDERHQQLLEESLAALQRASDDAWKRAKETGTPFIVWRDGKVVDLNVEADRHYKRSSEPGAVVREEPDEN